MARLPSPLPKFSLVLSGGAVRGIYHLGVLDALTDAGMRPTEICGCSAGAIIGALFAAQEEPDAEGLLRDTRLRSLVGLSATGTGVFSTAKLETFLRERLPKNIEDLRVPLVINATDMVTGDEVVFRKGPLVPALLASSAIPGIFPLVELNGRLLADGGVLNNLPLGLARERAIIASDVTFPLKKLDRTSWKANIVANALFIGIHAGVRRSMHDAKLAGKRLHVLRCHSPVFGGDLRETQQQALFTQGQKDGKKLVRELRKGKHTRKSAGGRI